MYGTAPENAFEVIVVALDPGFGYQLQGTMLVAGVKTFINEHYPTEAEVASRLAAGWSSWAAQVDSEPVP